MVILNYMEYIENKCRICGKDEYHELTYSQASQKCLEYLQRERNKVNDLQFWNKSLKKENEMLERQLGLNFPTEYSS